MKALKIFLCLATISFAINILQSQAIAVDEPSLLVASSGQGWVNPKWSPDGRHIAFSPEGYGGIWILTIDEKEPRQISENQGIGFGFSWSPNSMDILVRSSEYVDNRRLQSIKTINVANSKVITLVEPTRGIKTLPMWVNNGNGVLVVVNEVLELKTIADGNKGWNSHLEIQPVIYSLDGKMFVAYPEKNQKQEVADFGSRTIFNVTLSPSGKKIAFQVAAKGLYLINSDGSGLRHLGYGERPSWFPTEDYLAVMKTTDDGHIFTSGAIYAVCLATGLETSLVDVHGIIALSPSVSPDGKKIAFENHTNGDILIVNLEN